MRVLRAWQRRVMTYTLAGAVCVFADLRILESTPSRVTCAWELGEYGVHVGPDAQVSVLWAASANMELGETGAPLIPARSFYVGVPQGGYAHAVVVPLEVTSETLRYPLVRRGPMPVVGRPGLRFEQAWLSHGEHTIIGQMRACYYVLRPFVYDESRGVVQVLRRARVEITIEQGSPVAMAPLVKSHYDAVLRRVLLNYDVAKAWGAPPVSQTQRKAAAVFPLAIDRPMGRFQIGDGTGNGPGGLSEGTTYENGLIRIPGSAVRSVLGNGTNMSAVALYASTKSDLPVRLPDIGTVSSAFVKVPLLKVDVDGDGRVDDEDWFLTHVTGGSDWYYDTLYGEYRYRLDRYDDYRTYWVVSEERTDGMSRFEQPAGSPVRVADHFTNRLLLKRSRLIPGDDREATLEFAWERFAPATPPLVLNLPSEIDRDSAGSIRLVRGVTRGGGSLGLVVGGTTVCNGCASDVWLPVSQWGNGRLEVGFSGTGGADAFAELVQIEVRYVQELVLPQNGRLTVFGASGSGLVEYRLAGLPSGQTAYIVRIPRNERNMSLVDSVRSGGTYSWVDTAGIGVRYHIAVESSFHPVPAIERYRSANTEFNGIVNLHQGRVCDYLVVYHRDFAAQASRLAQHKKNIGRFTNPAVVEIGDVYREFSAGKTDPIALRHFLIYARRYWPQGNALTYVVLMGLGHWDYRHVVSQEPVYIPVWQGRGWAKPVCIEDSLAGDSLAVILGRIPCKTLAEAKAYVDKVIDLEDFSAADWGPWRNRLVLVADNDRQGNTYDGIGHHRSSELVARTVLSRWPAVELRKIYLFEYRFTEQGVMTEAADALVRQINSGVGYVNYFGHGGDNVWADERVLAVEDISRLSNVRQYPLVSSLSCRVGMFDKPDHDCMSDLLVRAPSAGAIATVAATRDAYASTNEPLGRDMFAALFDSAGPATMGEAYVSARLLNRSASLEGYSFLGDPSIRLLNPAHEVVMGVYDMRDSVCDTLQALQQVRIRGLVRRKNQTVPDGQYGTTDRPAYVQLGLYNPSYSGVRRDGLPYAVEYTMPGSPVFVARTQVRGGRFEQAALIPRSVVLDKSGVRLIAYAWRDSLDAVGYHSSLVFHGTDTAGAVQSDTVGPLIAVRPYAGKDRTSALFTDVVRSPIPLRCEIVVIDPSGVDVVGTGPDEGITVEVPGVLSKRSANQAFQFKEGSYQEGIVPFALTDELVPPGRYRLVVTARDLLANISTLSVDLEVLDSTAVTLDHVVNYPNPMRMGEGTRFYYHAAAGDLAEVRPDVVLKIYTMSGKLLRTVRQIPNGWLWDGTDQMGNRLGPNVYLWRMIIAGAGSNGEDLTSPLRKLVIHPPR